MLSLKYVLGSSLEPPDPGSWQRHYFGGFSWWI